MTLHTHLRYKSPLIRIDDYHCDGHTAHDGEERALNHEIVFVRAGIFTRYDAFARATVDANHVLFFNRNHPYHISHPVNCGDHCTVFTIADSALCDLLQTYDPTTADRRDRPFPLSYAPVAAQHRLLQTQLLHTLTQNEMTASLAFDEQILLLLGDTIAAAYRAVGQGSDAAHPQTRAAHVELVNAVKAVLARSFHKRLTLDEIAQTVYASPYHLCRVFRRETGQTIHSYIQHLRLYHALERIAAAHEDDFMTLALNLGFSSHSHFSTVFSRTFGLTPSTFRNSVNTHTLRQLRKILKV